MLQQAHDTDCGFPNSPDVFYNAPGYDSCDLDGFCNLLVRRIFHPNFLRQLGLFDAGHNLTSCISVAVGLPAESGECSFVALFVETFACHVAAAESA